MTFRDIMESLGFDLPEVQELFRCILSATKRGLSKEQIHWLLQERRRDEMFLRVMRLP